MSYSKKQNSIVEDINEIKDLIQVENEMILEFIKVNPYPNYKEMLENIKDFIELVSEYGPSQHICCKIIYENPRNKKLIVEMGKKIYEMGGFNALQANHSIIKYFSPYWKNNTNNIIKSQGSIIEQYFEEVSLEWKC